MAYMGLYLYEFILLLFLEIIFVNQIIFWLWYSIEIHTFNGKN